MSKFLTSALFCAMVGCFCAPQLAAEKVVLLHTNDTHSQIDPADNGNGGILRRKVVIDSVRAENPNTIVIDAGDAVQGTLYFNKYGGEVEYSALNNLGYDYAILGNHDFDNGAEALAKNLADTKVQWLSSNYRFENPELGRHFKNFDIRQIGDKKVGFIAINLQPKGMISEGNYNGVVYTDGLRAADAASWYLKNIENVDLVVAITHIGYQDVPGYSDFDIAAGTDNIDIILGGHSHTLVKPGSGDEWAKNKAGKDVLVVQNGKSGALVSEVVVDLDSIGTAHPVYRQIAINSRLDDRIDQQLEAGLKEYRAGIEEMMNKKIATSAVELNNDEPALINFVSDFGLACGKKLVPDGKVDLAIMNKGSLRRSLPKGDISEGQIITLQPFANHMLVMDISGKDLREAFNVMASRGGDGVSEGVDVTYNPETKEVTELTINGKPLDDDATYRLATIDYLANGGDYMTPLTRGSVVATSPNVVYAELLDYIKSNYSRRKINPSSAERFRSRK